MCPTDHDKIITKQDEHRELSVLLSCVTVFLYAFSIQHKLKLKFPKNRMSFWFEEYTVRHTAGPLLICQCLSCIYASVSYSNDTILTRSFQRCHHGVLLSLTSSRIVRHWVNKYAITISYRYYGNVMPHHPVSRRMWRQFLQQPYNWHYQQKRF